MAKGAKITSDHITIGQTGEQIAALYLKNQGFEIMQRNYRKKWGEIDIIAKKNSQIHFVEVKTVSYDTKQDLMKAVSYGTWRPEENVHPFKLKKLARAIESWLAEYNYNDIWQLDVIALRIVPRETFASVKTIENIAFE